MCEHWLVQQYAGAVQCLFRLVIVRSEGLAADPLQHPNPLQNIEVRVFADPQQYFFSRRGCLWLDNVVVVGFCD